MVMKKHNKIFFKKLSRLTGGDRVGKKEAEEECLRKGTGVEKDRVCNSIAHRGNCK